MAETNASLRSTSLNSQKRGEVDVPRFFLLIGFGLLAASAHSVELSPPPSYFEARDKGWAEAVLQTREAPAVLDFLSQVAGWEVEGPFCAEQSCEWRVADADNGVGALRLRQLAGVYSDREQEAAEAWRPGGLFSLMVRSNALKTIVEQARGRGWQAVSEPVSLEFGAVQLLNVILRHSAGGVISIYERLVPRMPDAEDLRRLRRPFNSMQVVADMVAARHFYVEVLGFSVIAEGRFSGSPHGPNNFGLPPGNEHARTLDYLIVAPTRDASTHVEIVRFVGAPPALGSGDPRSAASTSVSGLVALRFPVSSLRAVREQLQRHGWDIADEVELPFPPFGSKKTIRVYSPEGALLEFFEL